MNKYNISLLLLLIILSQLNLCHSGLTRSQLLSQLLDPTRYDETLRPYLNTTSPVVVELAYRLNLLYLVDSREETFACDLFVIERWTDPRLSFNPSQFSLPYSDALKLPSSGVWKPDTFFYNSIKCSSTDSVMKLESSGRITWTRHMLCTFYSGFDLHSFPFDSQNFPIKRLSFSYDTANMKLLLSTNGCFQPDPKTDYTNSLWELGDYECIQSILDSDHVTSDIMESSFTSVNLLVNRRWQSYMLKMILPMFLLVLLSCLSYWIDPTSPPARVGISVLLVVTISNFNALVSQDLPKINYSTLLDWYVWKCFLFVIFAVGEFALVHHLIVSKTYSTELAKLVDDFFQWTTPVVWTLSNILYWPFITHVGFLLFIGILLILTIVGNIYRIYWNYHHQKKGMIAPVTTLVKNIAAKCCKNANPNQFIEALNRLGAEQERTQQLEKQQQSLQDNESEHNISDVVKVQVNDIDIDNNPFESVLPDSPSNTHHNLISDSANSNTSTRSHIQINDEKEFDLT